MPADDAFPPGWHETNVRAILQIQVLAAEVEQLEAELKRVENENVGLVQTNDMLRHVNERLRRDVADAERGNCPHPWDRRATSWGGNNMPVTRCSVCGETIIETKDPVEPPPTPQLTVEQRKRIDKMLTEELDKAFKNADPNRR